MTADHRLHCPKCSSSDVLTHGKRYALYPAGCVAILSLPFAWLHRESTPIDFECRACGHQFSKRTKAAKIARIGLWAMVAFAIVWAFVMAMR